MLFAALLLGCGRGQVAAPADAGDDAAGLVARAEALLADAPLPDRLEAVALADAVALASVRTRLDPAAAAGAPFTGRSIEAARLAQLAADLRRRLWRFDRAAADANEAIELYAEAARLAAGTEAGCEAERRRALLAGELAGDAAATYSKIYLVSRRQSALAGPPVPGVAAPAAACLARLDRALAQAIAYRPAAEAMRALEREGDAAAQAPTKSVGVPSTTPSGAAAGAAADPSGAPSAGVSPAGPTADVVVSPIDDASTRAPAKLVAIERYANDEGARIVLRLSSPATFQVGVLPADDASGKDARIYLDLARVNARGIARETPVGGVVHRVRVAANGGGTRVVMDLAASLYRRIFYLPDPFRVVIDLGTRPPSTGEKQGAAGVREVRRIAIDPGHGGNDAGAVGPTGLREKDVTLDIAHRVAPLLAHELKIETLLTRDNDVYVPLDLRAARANAFHADLFVSIHCNASENGKATGVQTFVLDEAREGSAARLAARENAQRSLKDDDVKGADLSLILANLNVGDMTARSRHVADLLQRAALGSLLPRYPDTKDQGIKTAGFYVLVGAEMPAVLFETAFISNPDDEGRLATADYRQKLADSIANAIKAYKAGK